MKTTLKVLIQFKALKSKKLYQTMEGKTLQGKHQSNRMKLQRIEQSTKPIVISFVNKYKKMEKIQ